MITQRSDVVRQHFVGIEPKGRPCAAAVWRQTVIFGSPVSQAIMHCCTEVTGETEPMPACSKQWTSIGFVCTLQHVCNTCANSLTRLDQPAMANLALSRSRSLTTATGDPPQQQILLHFRVRRGRQMQPSLLMQWVLTEQPKLQWELTQTKSTPHHTQCMSHHSHQGKEAGATRSQQWDCTA